MTEFSCLDCKHHTHWYNSPNMGEGEPELEFCCNHKLIAEFEIEDESELVNIAENCDYFEDNITVEKIYLASINEQEICQLGNLIKKEYLLESHTENSLKMAFFLIAKSAINLYAKNYSDENRCLETLKNHELVKELANKLQHYFLEVYQ
ncbi:hypothetical protein [Nodularia spumigena]|uniref:Uncharacterized protein n=1 Tax=Nodularia spumigena UHCC 0060 TaxID=3110300 RepID=A0ABU5UU64_NODSP|nr:hypothetical protein [Nodularia spumigena]MEA5526957.1 hypothetical protein [Nodularia spumigena UHCC 0143]MEA5609845.1 hypothetical protein [Nodularia spumigena UHCC 0060]MEA5615571.1 hypothetical protein [Nodularia spumigena UHCC 0040]